MTHDESILPVNPQTEPPPNLPVFELCHIGIVLRALLGVQGLLGLMLGLTSPNFDQWLARFFEANAVSVPALLTWMVVVCALQLRLAAWPLLRVRVALMVLGAGCAWVPWWLGGLWLELAGDPAPNPFRGLVVALCGAVAAALLLQWLLLRARAQAPVGMQARWVELQSRIRPHFLFNTLNTAVALVRIDPRRAETVLEDLGELFQAALAGPGLVSTLGDEVKLAKRYLDIEELRFGARLRLQWELDPEAAEARLPPLLIQPLVENAVRYGVEPNEDGGEVLVRTRRKGREVELLVRNSVSGRVPGGHGLALTNVRERLNLLHDLAAQFQIEAEARRFSVRIILPL